MDAPGRDCNRQRTAERPTPGETRDGTAVVRSPSRGFELGPAGVGSARRRSGVTGPACESGRIASFAEINRPTAPCCASPDPAGETTNADGLRAPPFWWTRSNERRSAPAASAPSHRRRSQGDRLGTRFTPRSRRTCGPTAAHELGAQAVGVADVSIACWALSDWPMDTLRGLARSATGTRMVSTPSCKSASRWSKSRPSPSWI